MNFKQSTKSQILFVDDRPDEPIKSMMIETLQSFGFDVIVCVKWTEVIDFIKNCLKYKYKIPNLALIDIHFKKDSLELGDDEDQEGLLIIRQLVELCSEYGLSTPFITAYTSVNNLLQSRMALEYGADDFISAKEFANPQNLIYRLYLSIFEKITPQPDPFISDEDERQTDALILKDLLIANNDDIKEAARIMSIPIKDAKILRNEYLTINGEI